MSEISTKLLNVFNSIKLYSSKKSSKNRLKTPLTVKNSKHSNKSATRKIQKFMKTYRPKMRAKFLKAICSDSGVCITFGKEIKRIKDHFNGFNKFDYVSKIKRIGKLSLNGFVNEITYENAGYKSHAILKSSTQEKSDNLYYEYLVGQYINKLNLIYPCFLETYDCFVYENEDEWKNMMENKTIDVKKILKPLPEMAFKESCEKSKYISILTQHINASKTLKDMFNDKKYNDYFMNIEMVYIFYQIYMALSCVATTFTHYDLHLDNVLVYEPVEGKYIEYHYHKNGEEITFKSNYIVKIIDYGRSFFKDNDTETGSSQNIMKNICKTEECTIQKTNDKGELNTYNCGIFQGYTWIKERTKDELYFRNHLCGYVNNVSYDLRLMCLMENKYYYHDIENSFNKLLEKVCYGEETRKGGCSGTIENKKSGLPKYINNVIDAHDALLALVKNAYFKSENNSFKHGSKLGDLHIYYDGRPMKFEPYNNNNNNNNNSFFSRQNTVVCKSASCFGW
jgi:hypothetical protein